MPRRSPLPRELPARFSVSRAVEIGVSPSRLARDDIRRPFNGVRAVDAAHDDSLLETCLDYAPRLAPEQFFSHDTGLALGGVPTPKWPYRPAIHVATHRPAREPRTRGVVGHRLQQREPATLESAAGLPIESPVRAWRQVGTLWRLDDLIVAADYLVSDRGRHPIATVDELAFEVETMGDVRGGILRRAISHVRVGVRSPRETEFRLALVRGGLPEPAINWVVRDGRGIPLLELDLAYPKWSVAPEYDGRVHAEDPKQFARDADRWDLIRELGWDHVRILNHHMPNEGRAAVEKVRTALLRAGWRPGQT